MTCIIGIATNKGVWIGGDSLSSDGYSKNETRLNKIFTNGELLIGYTSSFRMGQLLEFCEFPNIPGETSIYKYMVTQFIPSVRDIFKSAGYTKIENNTETGGVFLVGIRKKLFCICSDFQVQEHNDNFYAIGAGQDYALGALQFMKTNGLISIQKKAF